MKIDNISSIFEDFFFDFLGSGGFSAGWCMTMSSTTLSRSSPGAILDVETCGRLTSMSSANRRSKSY